MHAKCLYFYKEQKKKNNKMIFTNSIGHKKWSQNSHESANRKKYNFFFHNFAQNSSLHVFFFEMRLKSSMWDEARLNYWTNEVWCVKHTLSRTFIIELKFMCNICNNMAKVNWIQACNEKCFVIQDAQIHYNLKAQRMKNHGIVWIYFFLCT